MKRSFRRFAGLPNLLVASGACLVLVALVGYGRASLEQGQLKAEWPERPVLPGPAVLAAAAGEPEAPREGEPVARLTIPRIGLDAVVLEGISEKTLAVAPGHYPGMAFPGDGGHVVLSAHRDTFFKDLGKLDAGDSIRLARPDGREVRYAVSRVYIVHKTDRTVIVPRDEELLTLITCYPFQYVGHAPYRYIVEALPDANDGTLPETRPTS